MKNGKNDQKSQHSVKPTLQGANKKEMNQNDSSKNKQKDSHSK